MGNRALRLELPCAPPLPQLFELRLVLESGTAALAAEHRDEDDLRTMGQFLRDMRSTTDYSTFVTADIGFHRAIAAATKNPFLGLFTSFVDMRLWMKLRWQVREANGPRRVSHSANRERK